MLEKLLVKSVKFRQWLCRKPSAGLIWAAPSSVQYAATAAASTVRQAQAAARARWRNTTLLQAPLLLANGPSFHVSAMLFIYTYTLLSARTLTTRSLAVATRPCSCCLTIDAAAKAAYYTPEGAAQIRAADGFLHNHCPNSRVFTKGFFLTWCYAVQGHSRTPMSVPIESLYATSY